jgi:hypothetical protein
VPRHPCHVLQHPRRRRDCYLSRADSGAALTAGSARGTTANVSSRLATGVLAVSESLRTQRSCDRSRAQPPVLYRTTSHLVALIYFAAGSLALSQLCRRGSSTLAGRDSDSQLYVWLQHVAPSLLAAQAQRAAQSGTGRAMIDSLPRRLTQSCSAVRQVFLRAQAVILSAAPTSTHTTPKVSCIPCSIRAFALPTRQAPRAGEDVDGPPC